MSDINLEREFIDAHSDDLLNILELREYILKNPYYSQEDYVLIESTICRLFCIHSMASLELMIKEYIKKDKNGILKPLVYDENDKKSGVLSNEERVNKLKENYKKIGVEIDEDIINDYLAIRYLRNTISHSKWKENQKKFVIDRGFPDSLNKLNDFHLNKMINVNQYMMFYIVIVTIEGIEGIEGIEAIKGKCINKDKYINKVDNKPSKNDFINLTFRRLTEIAQEIGKYCETEQDKNKDKVIDEGIFYWKVYKSILEQFRITNKTVESKIEGMKLLYDNSNFMIPIAVNKLEPMYFYFNEKFKDNLSMWNDPIFSLFEGKITELNGKEVLEIIILGYYIYRYMPINYNILRMLKYIGNIEIVNKDYWDNEISFVSQLYLYSRYFYSVVEDKSKSGVVERVGLNISNILRE